MAEQKRCIRCERLIDSYARICPYCNWDQSDPAVTRDEQTPRQTYVPPADVPWRRYAVMAGAAVLLLVAAFALGSKLQGHKPPVRGMEQQEESEKTTVTTTAAGRPAPHADVMLVPVNSNDTVAVDQPITSAPAPAQTEGVPAEYQRSDATAVSSVEYAQLAARAQAEKKAKEQQQNTVDPRSLTGPAYAQGEPPKREEPPRMSALAEPPASGTQPPQPSNTPAPVPEPARIIVSTRPVPRYQPLPDIQVQETTLVRLQLTIGPDGRVKEVNVIQGVPGQTSQIIRALQAWRFKPATENGMPVSAPFNVDLSFRGQ